MDYSRKIAERQWNLPDKGELESRREATFIDDIIQKDHLQRKLLENLEGIETVFDGGAGCGRFSILLAKQGCRVTHFDISRPMIDKARELAAEAGVLDRITFVQGALEDLSACTDRSFDLVISFDAPVSYTWPNQERVIAELTRIARKRVMLSVSSRLGTLPYLANPIQKNQFFLDEQADDPFVRWCVENRERTVEGFRFDKARAEKLLEDGIMGGEEEIAEYERGGAPWCITYAFLPDELTGLLTQNGVTDIRLSGPGAYGRTIPREILVKLMNDPEQRKDFLDFCYRFDSSPWVCGMGKDNLLAIGEIPEEKAGPALEPMDAFFAARLAGYDEHMRQTIEGASAFYDYTAGLLPSEAGAAVLDLGCGTGLELEAYFARNPDARVTGIDLSPEMLDALRSKFPEKPLRLINGSYFDVPLGEAAYDAAVSVESLHHFPAEMKRALYEKLRRALKPGGFFVLTDYFAESEALEAEYFRNLAQLKREQGIGEDVFCHYDTPLTVDHETEILRQAGFRDVRALKQWGSTWTVVALV